MSNGDVVLTGSVAAAADVDTLERAVAGVDGAVSIDNQIVVRDEPPAVTAAAR